MLVHAGSLAWSVSACDAPPPSTVLLATAHQVGPVGYRDPAGAVSPDGRRLAYSEGRHIVVQEIDGAGRRTLGPAPSQVRYLTWLPDSRGVLVHERSSDRRRQDWFVYDADTGEKVSLWGGGPFPDHVPRSAELLELSWSPDRDWLVGARRRGERSQVWRLAADGRDGELLAEGGRLSHPVVSPAGDVACIERRGGVQRLRLPCREGPVGWMEDHQPYGQVAFSPDGQAIYYAAPGDNGALDLWTRPVGWGEARRLATAERDAYGPSVTRDGNVVYRTQRYMVSISATPAAGGEPTRITTFQSETPSWSPSGDELSFTFGGWRLATDDVEYPDIDQQIGIVDANSRRPKSAPDRVVRESYSEDQGMHWSPNGRWIAYHSHVDGTDDIYIVAAGDSIVAAGDSLAVPRLISSGGRETGWPRWSPDGRWIAFPTYVHAPSGARRSVLQLIPVDQETGATQPQRRLAMGDFRHDALQAEWMPDSRRLVFEAAEGAGRKALYWIPVESEEGGMPTRFHEWESEQVHSGIAVSPDGAWVAYVGPGDAGFFQVHRVPFGGGRAEQLTTDPSHKTQPAYDPSGARLAYAVFEYQARFWMLASEEAPR